MAQTVRRTPPFTLNTDGHPHPRENTLVGIAAVLGLLAFTTAFFDNLHLISSWAGLFGILTALWGQFVSVTTAERFVLMVSLVMAGFGFYLGVAHGGLYGGA
ncbi:MULTISPECIES: hypothetical protein [unclassified Kitasatospora]|uniref:hypothetical protein n=1 Tax=unclassified Kitasatospora TaxID=2633591 RepID=UPI00070C68E4|nr:MULTISPECIES: hypothetical protein [unclassified Kitasatospora]KQV22185.1 hypothetical protein ASC99_17660 [Kitasatospora sp. Root107]KRB64583.1 hypothetical protein ASE03_32705 [Kitasatospora sp. Root187]